MSAIETISIKGIPFESCPECHTRIRYSYRSNKHDFQTLEGRKRTFTCFYTCENGHKFSPENPWVFPRKDFGKDIHALVNYYRHKKKRTLEEIREILEDEYGISIAPESIRNMILTYQILNYKHVPDEKLEQMRENKGVVLSFDALDPTKGADALHVIRDQLTDTILASKFIYSASEKVLSNFYLEIKEQLDMLDIPILGIISDKQRGQEKAIELVFPNVPHQLCIYHFLRYAAGPATKWDNHLATQLKKNIRRNHYMQEYKKKLSPPTTNSHFRACSHLSELDIERKSALPI